MEAGVRSRTAPLTALPRGSDLMTPEYSEADIAWLEEQDLTDPAVRTALEIACERNGPEERRLVGFKRSLLGYGWGTEADLRERMAEAHAVLKDNPKHCDTRTKRLMAVIGLACLHRRRSWGR